MSVGVVSDAFSLLLLATVNGVVIWKKSMNESLKSDDTYLALTDYMSDRTSFHVYDSDKIIAIAKVSNAELAASWAIDDELICGMLKSLCQAYHESRESGRLFDIGPEWIQNALALEKADRRRSKEVQGVIKPERPPKDREVSLGMALFEMIRRWIFGAKSSLQYSSVDAMIEAISLKLKAANIAAQAVEWIVQDVTAYLRNSTDLTQQNLKEAFSVTLQKVMKPPQQKNLLRTASAAISTGKLYIIAIMGTNGVGKSTSLAKLAYLLKKSVSNHILVAACDTFRAGAIEQLQQHCSALDLSLFEQGYGRDPVQVARNAVDYAKMNNFEILLIDTAGRMQNNAPLMQVLGNLVATIVPDMNLFVGEALVGNDALDQIRQFDSIITTASRNQVSKYQYKSVFQLSIDGVLLTKFDTVDSKVGTCISLAFESKKPILFVGTGQQYKDLNTLQVRESYLAAVCRLKTLLTRCYLNWY